MQQESRPVWSSLPAHPNLRSESERQHEARTTATRLSPSRAHEGKATPPPFMLQHSQLAEKQTHLIKASQQAGDAPLDVLLGQAGASSVAPHRVPAGDARDGGGNSPRGEGRSRDDRGEAAAGGGGDDGPARGGGGGSEDGC